ncbi:MAG: PQQ-binding-like beta-propeller repeat protein [Bacteroidales bacterium]|nr:PQQ-binding-like beta-propeller repeat protein [Bacteroidales bacterium]
MKKYIVILISLLLLLPSCYRHEGLDYSNWYTRSAGDEPEPESIEGLLVMSSNVRYYSARNKQNDPDVGDRDWEVRKAGYFQMVNTMEPPVLGLQEAEMIQVDDIIANCKGYSYIGVGRNDGVRSGESTAILYKTNEIQVDNWGTIWLSATPDVPGSYFPENEDRACRTATWAVLTVKENGRKFFYLNTHLSLYAASQSKEVLVILNTVAEKCPAGLPVVLSADWNVEEDDSALAPILAKYSSARQTAPLTDNIETFHWWGSQSTISKHQHLDHIFYGGFDKCLRFRTLNVKWKGYWISDHHPVYAVLQFKGGGGEVHTPPVADFDLPANPQMDETLKFTDKSTSEDGIELWEWNIGGILSSEQNPEVVFNTFGNDIPVSLTVTDHYGQKATATKTLSVARSAGHDLTIEWCVLYDDTSDDKGTAVADWTAPAVSADGSKIYVASSGYHLVGFNNNGTIFGSYDIGKRSPYISDRDIQTPTPSIDAQGNVYIPVQYGYSADGHGGLYSVKGDLSDENWYHDTGNNSQYRCTIATPIGDYVAVPMTNCGNDITLNFAVFKRSDGSVQQCLQCDKGSWGGAAIGYNGEFVYGTARGGTNQGRKPGTESGGGYHIATVDGTIGNWKTTANTDGDRKNNLLGMRHTDGNGYLTKACQPVIGTNHGVYVSATSDNENMICAKYNLDSYVVGVAPTPLWKVELESHTTDGVLGIGCVLDPEGNAYFRTAGKVFRLNNRDGSLAWEYKTEGTYNTGVPAIDSMGYIYVVDYDNGHGGNKLLKLSSADGKLISEVSLDNPRTSPTIDKDGNIYVTGSSSSGAVLYKITCPKTTAPGSNWSQLGANPQKTCLAPGASF